MKKNQVNQNIPADDLGRLLECQQLMDDFLKYAINPKLSSFSKDEKISILKLHRDIANLVIALRIRRADCTDLIDDMDIIPSAAR